MRRVPLDQALQRRDAVLRAFVHPDGHLRELPARHAKRLVVLDHVAQSFEVGVRYPEAEVNALLRRFHGDYAAVRRYLVDDGFLTRENGIYWRSGGTVLVRAQRAPVLRTQVEPELRPSSGPRIAVLCSLNFPDMTDDVADLIRTLTRTALQTLASLGASWELLDTTTPLPDPEITAACDGLLVLGGGDIDGTVAGHTGPAANSYGVDRRADEDSLAAIRAAVGADRPVLGLCRGAQLVNVAFGGTIVPDLADFVLHRGGPGEPLFVDEPVTVLGGTRLAQLLGEGTLVGRTGHHQAVDRVAADLRVAARALDGVVEGVEHPDRWVVGVQWHPEDPAGSAKDRRKLFGGFLQACAAASARRRR